jgi:ABC-type branched-subunit amino acid transport system ATPase component
VNNHQFWRGALSELQRRFNSQFQIAKHTWTTREELLHALVVGPTGMGKSRWVQLFCQSVMADPYTTLILIDPGGDLFRALRDWAVLTRRSDRVLLFEPTAERILGYNATGQSHLPPAYRSARKVAAVLKVFGEGDQTQTPRARRWLYNVFVALIEAGLTLKEATHLLDLLENDYRAAIIERVQTATVRREWEVLQKMKLADRQGQIESTANRLRAFLDSPAGYILSQQRRSLAIEEIIKRHQILLCNLEPFQGLTPADARVLGLLLIDDLIAATFSRPQGQRSPVVLVIDEAADYLVSDIGYILRAGRKYNLTCILCVQDLAQLREDPQVYGDIIANTPTKIVFGDLPEEDLQLLAPLLFRPEWDIHQRKLELEHIRLKPVETTRSIEINSWSESTGESTGQGQGQSIIPRPGLSEDLMITYEQFNFGQFHSSTAGGSTSEIPWYDYEEVPELASVQFYSLEELQHLTMTKLKSMRPREIAIKLRGKPVRFDQTPDCPDLFVSPHLIEQFTHEVWTLHPYYATIEEIVAEEDQRLSDLVKRPTQSNPTDDDDPITFVDP